MNTEPPAPIQFTHAARQLAMLSRLGERIRTDLRLAIGEIPPERRPTTELSRWLKVNRSICHWVKAAARHEGEPVLVFRLLPGDEGLEMLLRALRGKIVEPRQIDGALAALNAYREAIGLAGGSQAKLVRLAARLLEAENQATSADPDLDKRERLYDAAAELCGERSQGFCLVCAINPGPGPDEVTCVAALGQAGVTREARHLPVVLSRRRDGAYARGPGQVLDARPADGFPSGAAGGAIGRFSTLPLPVITTEARDRSHVQVLDPRGATPREVTVFIGERFTSAQPRAAGSNPLVISAIPRVPARWLVVDVHVHRDVRLAGDPRGLAHFIGAEGATAVAPDQRWYDRLENGPTVRRLRKSPADWASLAFAELPAVAGMVLEQAGQDRSRYTGWRLEQAFPIWGIQYMLCCAVEPGTA